MPDPRAKTVPPDLPIQVLPFSLCHLASLARIERASYENPWTEAQFRKAIRQTDARTLVAAHRGMVVGYVLLHLWPRHIEIWNLAVEPEFRRRGVGRQLVACAKGTRNRKEIVRAAVRETNVAGQLFFRACGFVATGAAHCPQVADPSYNFEYHEADPGLAVLRSLLEGDGRVVRAGKQLRE